MSLASVGSFPSNYSGALKDGGGQKFSPLYSSVMCSESPKSVSHTKGASSVS